MITKLLSLLLFILSFSMFGKPVDLNRAKTVGLYFLQNKTNSTILKNSTTLELTYKAISGNSSEETVLFYVFNVEALGYIIVAGDDTVTAILGYSDQGNFTSENMPSNIKKWLEGYKKEISFVIENNLKATDEINASWSTNSSNYSTMGTTAVAPLIQTKWDQDPFVNAQCPGGSVSGCVATAMAQIMKFWNYPATGSSFHSYNHPQYGTLSAIFGTTTYQWSSMPNYVTSPNPAVATLMYHCGVSVEMNYSPESSGAQTLDVVDALKNYFNYSTSIQGLYMTNYSSVQWINLLKAELNANRPIQYAGTGTGGGHSFVCDGYDNNDYFHFNWGWGGNSDGYFQINYLNPGSLGAGGGTGGFNSNQRAIIGIQPPSSATNYNISLYNNLTPSATLIGYGNPFTVTTNIANLGTSTFSGDYGVAAFDSSSNFTDFVEVKTNYGDLQAGDHYNNNLTFSTTGSFTLLPGTYTLMFLYRTTGGNWQFVNNGNYSNSAQINIVNTNPIQLNSSMTVSPSTPLAQGQNVSINLNILNNSTSTFIGEYQVALYNLDGSLAQEIETINELNGLPVGNTYNSPFLTFTNSSITANPGTYLIAVQHKSTTGEWELTGSTATFLNPRTVTITEAPLLADMYENNDTFNEAYTLPLNFTGTNANVNTISSNAHVGTDYDYYKVLLPSGYDYTITPRLHDSDSSGNGNTYSLDALFSYSTDGVNWSSAYDDVIPENITATNGGTIYFHVAPYSEGDTGTYLLDVNLSRTNNLGINENEFANSISVYPNPAIDVVTIDLSNFNGELKEVHIFNIQGQKITSTTVNSQSKRFTLPIGNFAQGVYLLQLTTDRGLLIKKLIISK